MTENDIRGQVAGFIGALDCMENATLENQKIAATATVIALGSKIFADVLVDINRIANALETLASKPDAP